ncbi:hypothetical protein Taro_025583, partial [Colocasia esculenta]|nr:hypothetical protein [Colocasia esculenta]
MSDSGTADGTIEARFSSLELIG